MPRPARAARAVASPAASDDASRSRSSSRSRSRSRSRSPVPPPPTRDRALDDPADDCETPPEAYAHVAPALAKLAQRLKRTRASLRIWDPYYCGGAAQRRLAALGFTAVANDPALDFYDVVSGANGALTPPHDALVTNPPFSGDHAKRLVAYLAARPPNEPFAVLAPAYIARKRWFEPLRRRCGKDAFVVAPRTRYAFWATRGGRSANADVTACRHWAREGRCAMGDRCMFQHGGSEARSRRGGGGEGGEGEAKDPRFESARDADDPRDDRRRRMMSPPVAKRKRKPDESSPSAHPRAASVSPFDVVWYVHCGVERNASVAAAWRQKFGAGGGPAGATMRGGGF